MCGCAYELLLVRWRTAAAKQFFFRKIERGNNLHTRQTACSRCLKEKSLTRLDLLNIPQSRKMLKRLNGIIGCKDKTSSWHLNGFPDGSNKR